MEVSVVQIGNSKGIRLSKTLLDKYQIKDSVELILENGFIILKPKSHPRRGWDESFAQMHESGDDKPLLDDVFEDENFDEWS